LYIDAVVNQEKRTDKLPAEITWSLPGVNPGNPVVY